MDINGKELIRNGGTSLNLTGTQLLFGYGGGDDYMHGIKTRHHSGQAADNAIDFYVWRHGTDATKAEPTKRVMTIDGAGADGAVRVYGLAGTGNRPVYADANGTLTTNSGGNQINMYRYTNYTVINIPDNNTQTNSNITVSGVVGTIVYMEVLVSINHTYDADLDIFLNGPNGNTIELSTDNGGSSDNYLSTIFTDNSSVCVTDGAASFDRGTFRPENGGTCQRGFRTNYYGINPNGTWQLRVWDDAGGDSGSIQGWEVRLWTQ